MADKHVVRLAPGKLGFYDPINNLNLMYPNKMEGVLPLGADLKYIIRAVKSGRIIDVNGTILGGAGKNSTQDAVKTVAVEVKEEPPADVPAVEEKQLEQQEEAEQREEVEESPKHTGKRKR